MAIVGCAAGDLSSDILLCNGVALWRMTERIVEYDNGYNGARGGEKTAVMFSSWPLLCPCYSRPYIPKDCMPCCLVYATADEAVAYMFYRCFFCFFFVRKNETTVLGNG